MATERWAVIQNPRTGSSLPCPVCSAPLSAIPRYDIGMTDEGFPWQLSCEKCDDEQIGAW